MSDDRRVIRADLTETDLDLALHVAEVADPRCGAVATFAGIVRNHAPDAAGEVRFLDYSSHPSGSDVLARIADDVLTAHPDVPVLRISLSHRVGRVPVAGLAVVVAVATPHRRAAFAVCEELIEMVKHQLPVWKRQETASGAGNWVGLTQV